ncbi:MAG: xanthine dehydrogenase, molybdenum binding subunit apoprotein, partial [Firmicutes bacterium]|nr:xanthine dehydrogenase, molybdenum binding subunit apoprotein [Bacillota bacterium]
MSTVERTVWRVAERTVGEPVRRNEDARLLTGGGLFVDDVHHPDMLQAAVVRSPHAHARILRIDVAAALALPGVELVLTAADLGALNGPMPVLISHEDLQHGRTHCALVADKVRYLGEPVAFVVARNRYIAEDAAELVVVEYEPLPAAVTLEAAVGPDAPLVHADVPQNVAGHYVRQVGDYAAARAQADLVLTERFRVDRGAPSPIETRGVVAIPQGDDVTMYVATQAPMALRASLAEWFGIPETNLRLIARDVGGGFGCKLMCYYPEEVLVLFAALRLKRPVKWIEDRLEHFVATTQERDQTYDVEVAVGSDGTLLGVKVNMLHDSGAYTPYGIQIPVISVTTLP